VWLAQAHVRLKPGINDPQGQVIKEALHNLGFADVVEVRVGKYMEIRIEESGLREAEEEVEKMCRMLLANPVMEDFEFQVSEI
jgi:phosphoribosylformylglycinamidine synthase